MTRNITQLFNDTVLDHFFNPRGVGVLDAPRAEGLAGSVKSGVFVQIQVRLDDDRVKEARFLTYGCVPAIACASFVTEWCRGRTTDEIHALNPHFVIESLGGLPSNRHLCAQLAVQALQQAVSRAKEQQTGLSSTGDCRSGHPPIPP